jgi:hypothetical protein
LKALLELTHARQVLVELDVVAAADGWGQRLGLLDGEVQHAGLELVTPLDVGHAGGGVEALDSVSKALPTWTVFGLNFPFLSNEMF